MTEAVFVAGASGVLGRRVVPALVAAGYAVTANVRNEAARRAAAAAGAATATIDLFDASATGRLGDEHDAVVNVATSIFDWFLGNTTIRLGNERPTPHRGVGEPRRWVARPAGRYVGESITFPYVDSGAEWIDESVERTYFWGNTSCVDAEAAASNVTNAGGHGVALRFAMFSAADSAQRGDPGDGPSGVLPIPGELDGFARRRHRRCRSCGGRWPRRSPPGIYNVAEPDPVRRADHAGALALRPVGVVSGHSRSRPSKAGRCRCRRRSLAAHLVGVADVGDEVGADAPGRRRLELTNPRGVPRGTTSVVRHVRLDHRTTRSSRRLGHRRPVRRPFGDARRRARLRRMGTDP